jgi:AhpD family alkylhydroperoxidase
MMARIEGMNRPRTLVARLAFFLSRRSYGRVNTPARVYALDSGLLLAVGLMEEVEARAKQTRAPVKQLARMLVAWRAGCPWCLDSGTRQAEPLGVTDEQLVALPDYEHSPLWSLEERAVLRYADAMTSTPVRVPDAVFEALKACYTDRQILEITAAIAWEHFHAHVSPETPYVAVDSSPTMIRLAQARLARFGSRVKFQQTDGSLQFDAASGSYDRFVSTYVADLLSTSDIAALFCEAHRLLLPGGRLCLLSLTTWTGLLSRLVMSAWTSLHRLSPTIVGGCRPLELQALLEAPFEGEGTR